VEDLHDENTVLRKRAGLGSADAVDIKGVRMQKQASIAQLRSLNALLERQVCVWCVCVCVCVQACVHACVQVGSHFEYTLCLFSKHRCMPALSPGSNSTLKHTMQDHGKQAKIIIALKYANILQI
jgi:hypothetical protein